MKEFIGALNAYHVLNFIVPGTLFVIILANFSNIDLIKEASLTSVLLYYFIGMVLSRMSSLVLEPLFLRIKIIKKYNYTDYIKASHVDQNIVTLLGVNNMYRTLFTMSLLLALLFVFEPYNIMHMRDDKAVLALLTLLTFIFAFAWQKQHGLISRRVQAIKDENFVLPKSKPSK